VGYSTLHGINKHISSATQFQYWCIQGISSVHNQ